MKLSILILTHNRPELFNRALSSIFNTNVDSGLSIYVNNDTCDIQEIKSTDHDIKYYYKSYDDLTDTYKFLFDVADGEFVYYLEDDDYLLPGFFKNIDYNYDINFMEYVSLPKINELGPIEGSKITKQVNISNSVTYDSFMKTFNDRYFQLGQILFRKSSLTAFPTEKNYIKNDLVVFNNLRKDSTLKYISQPTWVQTVDGGDNISFNHLNKDSRFK